MISATDFFCGAGGSALGAEATGRVTVELAANHWQTAIDVHQGHFPEARHDCADISQMDPRRYLRTDILIASPECTNHSQSRGVSSKRQQASLFDAPDPAAERSRATMWDVVRFAEQMDYEAIVVENVVDAATKWVLWEAWLTAMIALGYEWRVLSHNSMNHGVPQTRDRIYVVFTKPGLRPDLDLEVAGRCDRCDADVIARQAWKNGRTVGKHGQQYVWACTVCGSTVRVATAPAASIIEWDRPIERIGDRARPLADATRARILAGLQRHGWVPVATAGAGNVYETTPGNRSKPLTEPLAVQQGTPTSAIATPPGFLFQTAHGGRATGLDRAHPTVCASDDRQALVLANMAHNVPRSVTEPLAACTTGNRHGLIVRNNGDPGSGWATVPVSQPIHTQTTGGLFGVSSQSLLVPDDAGTAVDPDVVIDDCGFRMLQPTEVARAMAFPDGYIPVDIPKRDQVKLAGNAVTPPVMTWIVGRVAQAMEAV